MFQYTITELQEEVQASNEEIMSAMYEMHACLIDGKSIFCIFFPSHVKRLGV